MPREQRIEPFPKTHVWIPTEDGKFTHRPVTKGDKERRGLVLQLLTHPHFPRGTSDRVIADVMVHVREEKEQIRQDLENFKWPCHE